VSTPFLTRVERTLISASAVSLGIFVPLIAKGDKVEEVSQFLGAGYDLVLAEPETIQWFGIKYTDHTPATFAILDTFRTEAGRTAHLTGKVAEALMANAGTLLSAGPELTQPNVIANKVQEGTKGKTAGLGVGLRVMLTAKADKVQAVKDFLIVSSRFLAAYLWCAALKGIFVERRAARRG
jgi:hypothetical protein